MPVYLTSLEDPPAVDNVLAFLECYVPCTLGLIGNIVNSRPEFVKAIQVYTSFKVDFSKPVKPPPVVPGLDEALSSAPALFSVIALQPREQARFFCSADLKLSEPATPEEEAHVQGFFRDVIPIVAAFPPDNEDGPTLEYDINAVGVKGRGYHIGRVHDKWAPCLDPITIQRSGPLVCLVRPPPPSQPKGVPSPGTPSATNTAPDPKSDRWSISRFGPADIDFIQSASLISRHKAYLESRSHTSIVVHDRHLAGISEVDANADDKTPKKPNLVAWSIIQADGSFGVLWVEPSHRGLGLGDLVLNECINRSETYCGSGGAEVTGTGILGWHWADASPVNTRSIQFFSRQDGWRIGWGTQWITFDPDADLTTVDWSFRQTPTEESRRMEWGKNPRILLKRPTAGNNSH